MGKKRGKKDKTEETKKRGKQRLEKAYYEGNNIAHRTADAAGFESGINRRPKKKKVTVCVEVQNLWVEMQPHMRGKMF